MILGLIIAIVVITSLIHIFSPKKDIIHELRYTLAPDFKVSRAELTALRSCKRVCDNRYCLQETHVLFVRSMRILKEKKKWEDDELYTYLIMNACHLITERELDFRSEKIEIPIGLNNNLDDETWQIIEEFAPLVTKITNNEGASFYNKNTDAWSIRHQYLMKHFNNKQIEPFYEDVCTLCNHMMPKKSIARNIFYKTYIFLTPVNKGYALRFYLHYLSIKSDSDTFRHKKITRKNAKLLFANPKQEQQFNGICEKLQANGKIKQAQEKLSQLGIGERKKIQLNINAIHDAAGKQAKVAGILSDILSDDTESIPEAPQADKTDTTDTKEGVLELFIKNNFKLKKEEVDIFAQTHGVFKSQLIERINENYYEILDDILIEEDNEHYIMDKAYYEQIKG